MILSHSRVQIFLLMLIPFILLLASSVWSLSAGTAGVRPTDLFSDPPSPAVIDILFRLRLPRTLLGISAGAALSLSGVILQTLFRNPLIEPYTLGISGGASLAAALVIFCNIPILPTAIQLPAAGFIGALTVLLLIRRRASFAPPSTTSILIKGLMISFFSSSAVMFILALSSASQQNNILFWLMGSLEQSNTILVVLSLCLSIAGTAFALYMSKDLNTLILGRKEAARLGINADASTMHLLILASLLTGVTVSLTGVIGFVGLLIPHFCRFFTGSDHRLLIPCAAMVGAAYLVACDTLARIIIAPAELPVGVLTGLMGSGMFLFLFFRRSRAL
ncbi:MAG: FecCD family ABC transporter permease [Fibrobacterota bacterium]